MSLATSDVVERTLTRQRQHHSTRSVAHQKQIGQFFTPPNVARLMASMLGPLPERMRVLDPGAGAGILSAAVCERVAELSRPHSLEVHAYETDAHLLPTLHETLSHCRRLLRHRGHRMEFFVHPSDFILGGPACQNDLFGSGRDDGFDIVIMNPPYLKISKHSSYAAAMADVVHGQPNLYALFMALGANLLKPGGRFVSITPRSFCDGPYFRQFRCDFLSKMRLEHLHLFESRTAAFADSAVLQESIITFARRSAEPADTVRISQSFGPDTADPAQMIVVPRSLVIRDRGGSVIQVPTTSGDVAILEELNRWPHRFESIGLRVSTGPVVLFRAKAFVRAGVPTEGEVPLLLVQHVKPLETVWPGVGARKSLAFRINDESRKLLIEPANYVLTRRFSAKEEARRLTACVLPADAFGGQPFAIENHVNYITHCKRELTLQEARGIASYLNCALVDRYFRIISGSTQVNAAELRMLPIPDLETLAGIGAEVDRIGHTDRARLDRLLLDMLGINGEVRRHITEASATRKSCRGNQDPGGDRVAAGAAE